MRRACAGSWLGRMVPAAMVAATRRMSVAFEVSQQRHPPLRRPRTHAATGRRGRTTTKVDALPPPRTGQLAPCGLRQRPDFLHQGAESRGGAAPEVVSEALAGWRIHELPPRFCTRSRSHASPYFGSHQITPKTSRYTRCSMSMLPNVSINGRMRSSGQLGRWWYSMSPCRNNECVRRFTVFAFSQRS